MPSNLTSLRHLSNKLKIDNLNNSGSVLEVKGTKQSHYTQRVIKQEDAKRSSLENDSRGRKGPKMLILMQNVQEVELKLRQENSSKERRIVMKSRKGSKQPLLISDK